MTNLERKKIELRKVFTMDEKFEIRLKSDNLCSHCGCKLNESNMTVDHVIPLNKGGTNDLSNTVALCKTCNIEKDDTIIHPLDYYKYLKDCYMYELVKNQNKYYNETRWITNTNFMPEEIKQIEVPLLIPTGKRNNKVPIYQVNVKYQVRLANYTDLDNIFNYIKKCTEKYIAKEEQATDETIKEFLIFYFARGGIYICETIQGEIKCIIPIRIAKADEILEESEIEEFGTKGSLFFIENIFTLYQNNPTITNIVTDALRYILSNLGKLHLADYNLCTCLISVVASKFTKGIIKFLSYDSICTAYTVLNDEDKNPTCIYILNNAYLDGEYDCKKNDEYADSLSSKYNKSVTEMFCKNLDSRLSIPYKFNDRGTLSIECYDKYLIDKQNNIDLKVTKKEIQTKNEEIIPKKEANKVTKKKKVSSTKFDKKPKYCKKVDETYIKLFLNDIIVNERKLFNVNRDAVENRRSQIQNGNIPAIRIDENLKLVCEYDIYCALKELEFEVVDCRVTGVSKDLSSIDVSDFAKVQDIIENHEGRKLYSNLDLVKKQSNRCFICDKKFSVEDMPYDTKLIPVRKGGKTTEDNIVACHKFCKKLKGDFTWSESLKSLIIKELQ